MTRITDLHQATLDEATFDALFRDIAAFGQDVEVVPRHSVRQQVGDATMTLAEASNALRNQSIRAVQLRYNHDGQRWCDTLVRTQHRWRLTRINLSEAASV